MCRNVVSDLFLTDHVTLIFKITDHGFTSFKNAHTCIFATHFGHSSILKNCLFKCEIMLLVPFKVSQVSEGTTHNNSRTLAEINLIILKYRNCKVKQRNTDLLAEKMLILLIIRMNENALARCKKLRSCSCNLNVIAIFTVDIESQIIKQRRDFLCFKLCLSYSGLTFRTPQSRSLRKINLLLSVKIDK